MLVENDYYSLLEEEEFWMGYELWAKEHKKEPTSKELDLMERDFCKSLTTRNQIIAQNNENYNPFKIGA